MVVAGEACVGVEFPKGRLVEKCRHPADPMSLWKHYYLANSIEDALRALAASQGEARLIAGGTDLLLDLQQGRMPAVDTLVDVSQIQEMSSIDMDSSELSIGAATPLNHIIEAVSIPLHAMALFEACRLIAGPQVRNVATLGGNVAHALPAADGSIALLALDAQAEIACLNGRRRVAISELYAGAGKSTLLPGQEILVRFILPRQHIGQASAFERVMKPQGVALPVLNMALWLECSSYKKNKEIQDIRIAVGPGGPVPFRAKNTEAVLRQKPMQPEILERAKIAMCEEARFRTSSHRATSEYRYHLSGVLLEQVIHKAWTRAIRP